VDPLLPHGWAMLAEAIADELLVDPVSGDGRQVQDGEPGAVVLKSQPVLATTNRLEVVVGLGGDATGASSPRKRMSR